MIRKSPSPVFEAAVARRESEEFEGAFREKVSERGVFEAPGSLLISEVISCLRWPNQPLEPTRGSVTSRAFWLFEGKLFGKARLAPAPLVAHL